MKSVSTCVGFTPKIDALEGQRGNIPPWVGHCIVHTTAEWLQRFPGDQPYQEQVVLEDGIIGRELTQLPPVSMAQCWNSQHVPMIMANSFSQFCGKPVKDESIMDFFLEGSCTSPV
jgi:hypothetical protein